MQPYTYLIVFTHPRTKKTEYYYGVQYGRKSNPKNLFISYFTSSAAIKYRLKKYGKDSFQFEVRKTFPTSEKARLWKHKVLRRMKVVEKRNWLNSNDGLGPPPVHDQKKPPLWVLEKAISVRKEKLQNEDYRKWLQEKHKNRDNSSFKTESYRKLKQEQAKTRYLANPKMFGEINGMQGKKHSQATKDKISEKAKKRLEDPARRSMLMRTHTIKAKEAISKARKDTKWMYEPMTKTQRAVKTEDVEAFLKKGWQLGRPKKDLNEPDFLTTY